MMDQKKLSDQVKDQLLDMIRKDRVFKPGDKMPNELELAEKMGVSRSTLREAENQLVAMNVLSKSRGRGTYVLDPEADDNVEDAFENMSNLNYNRARLNDLYGLRLMLEPSIASLAALRADEGDIRTLEDINSKMSASQMTEEELVEYNRIFHITIARATHNDLIIKVFDQINNSIARYFNLEEEHVFGREEDRRSHEMILRAMKLKDQIGVRKMMELHLKNCTKYYENEILTEKA